MPSKALLTLVTFMSVTILTFNLNAQLKIISGSPEKGFENSKVLKSQFSDFEVYQINTEEFKNFAEKSGNNINFQFQLGDKKDWTVAMTPNNLKGQNYELKVKDESGQSIQKNRKNITYKGFLPGGTDVRLTINDDFVYGLFEEKNTTYYIEPLHYFESTAPKNLFVVYSEKDVIPVKGATCGFTEQHRMSRELEPQINSAEAAAAALACYDVDVRLAGDWLLNQDKGGVTAAENFMFGVLNNVATNFDDEFAHQMLLFAGGTFVSNCSSCDPWTSSTDASTLLGSFRSWGNSGGFGTTVFDVATLWTDRNLAGSTVGIAYVGGTCSFSKYNVCQDFTNNANNLRVLQAHELGHNFDALHDASGSPFIMAPAVNGSNTWSTASVNDINSFINFRLGQGGCFTPCAGGGGNPPVADFTSDVNNPHCPGDIINFTDLSTDNPDSWSWDFGDGGTSSQQDPSHTYNTPGIYTVSLIASNIDGSDTHTEVAYVEILNDPIADFSHTTNLNTAFFTNLSQFSNSWYWDFGDGTNGISQNPTHIYISDGLYTVQLEASNQCGVDIYTQDVEIVTPPIADFTSDVMGGCTPLTVQFFDQSSYNTTNVEWYFPGGNPSFSTQFNPTVTYTTPGTHDVRLIAYNSLYDDELEITAYINVDDQPAVAGFTHSVNLATVTFTDQSQNATNIDWDFGDGNTSSQTNPVHTYAMDGTYTVIQTANDLCGTDYDTAVINIVTPPTADFTASEEDGCTPFTVDFQNHSSSNVTAYEWTFPGGNPATSNEENPTVVYNNPGMYNVKLKVSNSLYDDELEFFNMIDVDTFPTPGFTFIQNLDTVFFTNTSQNFWYHLWDFDDGTTSSDMNPTHVFANDGTYNVQLEIENDCGVEFVQHQVTVVTPPTADFSGSPTTGCTDLSVSFSNSSSVNSNIYEWHFPGGNPSSSTELNPTVVYQNAGSYDVTLIAFNSSYSDTMTVTNYVDPSEIPGASFTNTTNLDTAFFTTTSAGYDNVFWDFGDGSTSAEMNPTHIYATTGTYNVQQITSNICGNDTTTQQVVISLLPTAGFTSGTTDGCVAFTTLFTSTSSSNTTSHSWSFPGGTPATSTDMNPTVVYNSKGNYDVTLIVGNNLGFDTLEMTNYITVKDLPASAFTEAVTNFTTVDFTNNSADATSYKWYFGNGDSSSVADPTYDYLTDGVYNVELRAFNDCGNTSSFKTLTIVTPPTADFSINQLNSGCTPYQVQFTSLASANATSLQWNFPGGTPSTFTGANPVITYSSVGDFDVELLVVNSAGNDTELKTDFISVTTVPNAGFTSAVNHLTADFTDISSGGSSVNWDFGDGNSSMSQSPSHTYAADGVYTVTQSVTNNCGTVNSTEILTIVTPPTAGFNADVTTGCAPLAVSYNNLSSTNATSYNWTFDGGIPATSTDANPVVSYSSKGEYDAQLIVTNAAGNDTVSFSQYIDVTDVPVSDFSEATNLAVVDFTNSSADANSYSWDFGDGNSSTMENPSHTYTMDGSYTVVLSATNHCGTVTSTKTVLIATQGPIADFVSSVASGCAPLTVQFNNSSSQNTVSILWQFTGGDIISSTDDDPVVVYTTPGVYDVTLIAINTIDNDTITKTGYVEVLGQPATSFSSSLDITTVDFTNATTGADTFEWTFGDGTMSTEENPSHTYPENGVYDVVLEATNSCGTTTFMETITINGTVPTVNFSVNNRVICVGDSINFNDMSSDNPENWNWTFEGGTPAASNLQNPTIVYGTPGTYPVTLESGNAYGIGSLTETGFITVEQNSVPGFTLTSDALTVDFTNASTGATSYSWDFGDGNTSTMENPSHTYASADTYTVILSATNSCGTFTHEENVTVMPSGLEDLSFLESLDVFPNPNSGQFTVEMKGTSSDLIQFRILNSMGQLMFEQKAGFRSGYLKHNFDLDLSAGIYLLQIQSNGQAGFKKIEIH